MRPDTAGPFVFGQIFDAMEKHCRTKYGYSGVHDVQQAVVRWNNQMPRYVPELCPSNTAP